MRDWIRHIERIGRWLQGSKGKYLAEWFNMASAAYVVGAVLDGQGMAFVYSAVLWVVGCTVLVKSEKER